MAVRNVNISNAKRRAGKKGAHARMLLYGNPGTKEGRSKGGKNSLIVHQTTNTGFKTLRHITAPERTSAYAEFLGIVIGDGHVDRYQVSISTNSETDMGHAAYIRKLAEDLFALPVTLSRKKSCKAVVIVLSSKAVCELLTAEGVPQGSKLNLGVAFPDWIRNDPEFVRSCARGLFDTDGCVFQDTHRIRGKTYTSVGIAFANSEPHVLSFFFQALVQNGLHPTQTSQHRVFLRRSRDVEAYFRIVGTSNPKHRDRFLAFRKDK